MTITDCCSFHVHNPSAKVWTLQHMDQWTTLQHPCSSLINKWGFYQPRVFCQFLPADVWQPRRARAASETLFCGATAVCSAARCWFLGLGAASSWSAAISKYPNYLTCEQINVYILRLSGYFAWSEILLLVAGWWWLVTPGSCGCRLVP